MLTLVSRIVLLMAPAYTIIGLYSEDPLRAADYMQGLLSVAMFPAVLTVYAGWSTFPKISIGENGLVLTSHEMLS